MRRPAEVLTEARKRIENRENWCQETHFITDDGADMIYHEDEPEVLNHVVACCADGAIILVTGSANRNGEYEQAQMFLGEAAHELFGKCPVDVNDDWNVKPTEAHANVLRMFHRAIELAEATR